MRAITTLTNLPNDITEANRRSQSIGDLDSVMRN